VRPWIAVEFALGLLLVTSFTCVGLVALWAATSPRHWFLRTAVVVAFLSPLLFIPAHDPFLVFVSQAATIAIGIAIYHWWQMRLKRVSPLAVPPNSQLHSPRTRYSLSSAMLAVALVAGALATCVRIPREVWLSWPSMLLIGVPFAVASLVGLWLAYGRSPTLRRIIVSAVVVMCDSVVLAYFIDWPRFITDAIQPEDFSNWPNIPTLFLPFLTKIWLVVTPVVAIATAFAIYLEREAQILPHATDKAFNPRSIRMRFATAFALVVVLILLPPTITAWKLMHPLPVNATVVPIPNGYDDLVAAGKMFHSQILGTAVEPHSSAELAAEVAKYSAAYNRCRLGLARNIVFPFTLPLDEYFARSLDADSQFRTVARALFMEA
jgi:hypothetical protein